MKQPHETPSCSIGNPDPLVPGPSRRGAGLRGTHVLSLASYSMGAQPGAAVGGVGRRFVYRQLPL